jgi:hypothetical protein
MNPASTVDLAGFFSPIPFEKLAGLINTHKIPAEKLAEFISSANQISPDKLAKFLLNQISPESNFS